MKTPSYMRQKLPVVLVAGLGGLFTVVDVASAQPWAATGAPSTPWKALAASADGSKLVAAAARKSYYGPIPGPIYVSTNAGATWIQTGTPSNNWSSVACSADGIKLVAVASLCQPGGRGDGLIYTSPDLGATWTPTSAPSNTWSAVASSADGARLVAVAGFGSVWNGTNYDYVGDGAIYSSLDSGASWTQTSAPSNSWTSVASSVDGAKLVAVAAPQPVWNYTNQNNDYVGDGAIYRSLDSGATWMRTSAPSYNWTSVASSADGARLVAVAAFPVTCPIVGGLVYISSNSGLTWMPTSAPLNDWMSVASSADGSELLAASRGPWGSSCGDSDGLIYISSNSGATWTPTDAPGDIWVAVASSADGQRHVAASGGFSVLLCTYPYSGPWRLTDAPASRLTGVASSADGTKLVAATDWYDSICTSSNSGATWSQTSAPKECWSSVTSSSDGAKLVAAVGQVNDQLGLIYTSGNLGVTWTLTTSPRNNWTSVASSADGTKLVAVAAPQRGWNGTNMPYFGDGLIYSSSNSGANWTQTSAPTNTWASVASSADGTKLVAVAGLPWDGLWSDRLIYTSANSGATWTPTTAPTNNWVSVSSSADGTKLVAVVAQSWGCGDSQPCIYTSTDSGANWVRSDSPAVLDWSGVASSSDGSHIVAVGDRIFTLRSPAPAPPLPSSPQLAVGLSGATLGLSWLVPSTRFVLQQNSDLSSTNWVDVPTPPTLDYTNLHQRLTLTPSLGSSYFRLKQQ